MGDEILKIYSYEFQWAFPMSYSLSSKGSLNYLGCPFHNNFQKTMSQIFMIHQDFSYSLKRGTHCKNVLEICQMCAALKMGLYRGLRSLKMHWICAAPKFKPNENSIDHLPLGKMYRKLLRKGHLKNWMTPYFTLISKPVTVCDSN